ncbi:enoyl-CoA hydratase/isomerase family protein [Euzebya tangerina]|uniref:enoyl-CoA hydratase/isomerase family protein n=1 Tax=Euzebya tangerina TaxID=591198 RepID=UPI000E3167A9|nr:enoyl-CoA hydratase/isomerase family protein [Euzebya tangerina]
MPPVTIADHQLESRGRIRVVTLSRPAVRNAMDTRLLMVLLDTLTDAVGDDDVAAIVLTGDAGHFSAGADLKEELDRAGQVRRMELFGQVYETVAMCPKAVVAAVVGSCVGGGAEVATACDIRVASTDITMRFPGTRMGVPVGAAKLVGLVGLGTAKDLVLSARTIDGTEAHRIGLVQRLAPAEAVLSTAVQVAETIAAGDPHTVTYLKAMFDRFSGLGDRVQAENDAIHALAEAGGDYTSLNQPNPKTTSGWSATAWKHR